jgi:hypothetical protein
MIRGKRGTNDFVDCGAGNDVAGIDVEGFGVPPSDTDIFAPNCEAVYIGIWPTTGPTGPVGEAVRLGSGTDLSAIDTREEVERAEADGLLR